MKTCVFSPLKQCSLSLKDRACIFLCEIFVSFVSGFHCKTGSWHDYERWHLGKSNLWIHEMRNLVLIVLMMSRILNLKLPLLILMMNHLSNLKLIVAAILILNFMRYKSLSKKVLLETILWSAPKWEEETQTMVELLEKKETFQSTGVL